MAIAIVDPFSSGLPLAFEVKARGHACWMVQSSPEVPAMYRSSYHPEVFDEIVVFRGSLEQTAEQLQAGNVRCVLPGCEMGVELADRLSRQLGLVSNGTKLSRARRDKAVMEQTLRQRGVRTPPSFTSGSLNDVRRWIHAEERWPVILKPLRSSGSDGVQLCRNDQEVAAAFESIMQARDVFGEANDEVLTQQFVSGSEYAIDTVSCRGRHKLVAIWKYGKSLPERSFFGSDSLELLRYCPDLERQFFPYVTQVLDALEINNGPAHCELIASQDGPVIIEIGARLNGGNNPMLSRYCGGESQIDLTLDAYLNPAEFLDRVDQPYRLSQNAMRVFLIPPQRGRLKADPQFDPIKGLPSFHELRFSAKPPRVLSRIAGWVLLVHEDPEVIHHDLQTIRRLEEDGLYPVESE